MRDLITYLTPPQPPKRRHCLYLFLGVLMGCTTWEDPTFNVVPQTISTLDSLSRTDNKIKQLEGATHHQQLDSLLVWTATLKDYNEAAALTYCREAVRRSIRYNLTKDQAVAYYYLALLEGREQLFQEGMADPLVNARISERLWEGTKERRWKVQVQHLLGDLYYRKEMPDSAVYHFQKGLELIPQPLTGDSAAWLSLEGNLYHGLGVVAADQENYPEAAKWFELAASYYDRASDRRAKAVLQQELAALQNRQERQDSAIVLLNASIQTSIADKDAYTLAGSYQRLGNLYMDRYRSTSSLTDYYHSDSLFRLGLSYQKENRYYTYRRLAMLMQSRANRDVERPDFVDSALVYNKIALEFAPKEGALDYFRTISRAIATLCAYRSSATGRDCAELLGVSSADYLYENYTSVVDTITHELNEANGNFLAFERRQQQIDSRRRLRNSWMASGIGLLIAGLVFLLLYQRQKQRRLQARMEALRAQINPHFFSNSLNAIESLVNLDQPKAASKYLIHFSRLTRRILTSSLEANTSLAGELETTRHFLALEQLRFKDKLHYEIIVEENVKPDDVAVPSLILQPYLENAIWHGLKPKDGAGLLQIHISREDQKLKCVVEDNGISRRKKDDFLKALDHFNLNP